MITQPPDVGRKPQYLHLTKGLPSNATAMLSAFRYTIALCTFLANENKAIKQAEGHVQEC